MILRQIICLLGLLAAAQGPTTQPSTHPFDGDAARKRWNETFARAEPSFNTKPNAFLVRCLERMPGKGTAIDIAMGQGRNAVALAMHGFETTGIDISDVAIGQAKKLAADAGVKLATVNADVFAYDYGKDRWDLVSIIYFNPARPILEKFKQAVRPGGYIVIEGFGRRKKGGPPDESKFDTNELIERFKDWQILEYQDGDFDADWGGEPKAHVIRLLARKPG
jgi:SAM-dependent methyltransferase